ncbi:MAG TPA: copper transporter [Mycobacteriales bacterium]|nr:copper transporter [Mycobacteriales bacterium]
MIDFRYHIVSLIAVFLALALGLFLGSTTLQSTVTHNLQNQAHHVNSLNRQLNDNFDAAKGELGQANAFTDAVEPYAVSERLLGQSVAVIAAPGVDDGQTKALVKTLDESGATITADVSLEAAFLDPTQDAELGALAQEIKLPGRRLPHGRGALAASAVLADALLTKPGRPAISRGRVDAALASLVQGKFISVSGTPASHPGELAVLLVPAANTSQSTVATNAENTVLLGLAADLRAASRATVLAGPTPGRGGDTGALSAARADAALSKTVSTVSIEPDAGVVPHVAGNPAAGRIAVVLGLASGLTGTVGSYGLEQTPPLPTPSPTP